MIEFRNIELIQLSICPAIFALIETFFFSFQMPNERNLFTKIPQWSSKKQFTYTFDDDGNGGRGSFTIFHEYYDICIKFSW